jgi:hypothetical protein
MNNKSSNRISNQIANQPFDSPTNSFKNPKLAERLELPNHHSTSLSDTDNDRIRLLNHENYHIDNNTCQTSYRSRGLRKLYDRSVGALLPSLIGYARRGTLVMATQQQAPTFYRSLRQQLICHSTIKRTT